MFVPNVGYKRSRQVFSDEQEAEREEYIQKAAKLYYGHSAKEVRSLAFDYGVNNNVKFPIGWSDVELASTDWFGGFLKRKKTLSIRTPEATSLSRATSFNKHNVGRFFTNLSEVYVGYKFQCQEVYNVDEAAVTTVHTPAKIVATKGIKQVGAITSAERGTLVTVALSVNASGNSIPPFFVFPRKNFRDYFLRNGPEGSAGSANKSGLMTGQDFRSFMLHFIHHSRATRERSVLLLLDNNQSHLDISVLHVAKENGVVLLSFPPHTSHKLQPLDRAVFGPFKKYINSASDAWMKNNAGSTMTIYDIPFIVKLSLLSAATPRNIKAGFQVNGIWPFNRDIFTDDEFLPSAVTDRPYREDETLLSVSLTNSVGDGVPSTSTSVESSPTPCTSTVGSANSIHTHMCYLKN
ncbi:uncharacterized protein LOC126095391 [Schistocerca cancellata]|uniref:uncharacterized protein LOC126095391 n=1 Tax=Schistocerca cancellata TaxID=274614 RepID=UPI002118EF8D|nr:uncharacterized protein LOC126095391 [Schistocerca cancellata]